MKQLVLSILIIIIVLSIGIFEQVTEESTLRRIIEYADDIISALNDENLGKASSLSEQLCNYYIDKKWLLELLTPHGELRDMQALIGEMMGNIASGDSKQALVRAYVVKSSALSHMDVLKFNIVNIL